MWLPGAQDTVMPATTYIGRPFTLPSNALCWIVGVGEQGKFSDLGEGEVSSKNDQKFSSPH